MAGSNNNNRPHRQIFIGQRNKTGVSEYLTYRAKKINTKKQPCKEPVHPE
jgi:hypothetical protein